MYSVNISREISIFLMMLLVFEVKHVIGAYFVIQFKADILMRI